MKNLNVLILILSMTVLVACSKKVNVIDKKKQDSTINNPTLPWEYATPRPTSTYPDPTPTPYPSIPDKCEGEGVGNKGADYYRFTNIIAHGSRYAAAAPVTVPGRNRNIAWTSDTAPNLQGSQSIFATDSLLKIRVMARRSPGQTTDSYGNQCTQMQKQYTKLQISVGLKVPGASTYIQSHTFSDVGIENCSNSYTFNPALIPEGDNLILEIFNVNWDWSCIWEQNKGNFGNLDPYCPWDQVWGLDCFELELQMVTDYTNDFPG